MRMRICEAVLPIQINNSCSKQRSWKLKDTTKSWRKKRWDGKKNSGPKRRKEKLHIPETEGTTWRNDSWRSCKKRTRHVEALLLLLLRVTHTHTMRCNLLSPPPRKTCQDWPTHAYIQQCVGNGTKGQGWRRLWLFWKWEWGLLQNWSWGVWLRRPWQVCSSSSSSNTLFFKKNTLHPPPPKTLWLIMLFFSSSLSFFFPTTYTHIHIYIHTGRMMVTILRWRQSMGAARMPRKKRAKNKLWQSVVKLMAKRSWTTSKTKCFYLKVK